MPYEIFSDPKTKGRERRFAGKSHDHITKAKIILDEYKAQGYRLTVRQLYYQFVSRGWLPSSAKAYDNLGTLMRNARYAGLIDWFAIEDRTRSLRGNKTYLDPLSAYKELYKKYKIDMWTNQDIVLEVWLEKEALSSVVSRACSPNDVNFYPSKGYDSASSIYRAGRRVARYMAESKHVRILHMGDFDPSGMDMSRDNEERLSLFARSVDVDFKRIALNEDQIKKYDPPPFYAKPSDKRHAGFVEKYGDKAYELDALEPSVIVQLINDEIDAVRDPDKWRLKEEQLAWDKYQLFKDMEKLK